MLIMLEGNRGCVHIDVNAVKMAWMKNNRCALKFGKDDVLYIDRESYDKVVRNLDWDEDSESDENTTDLAKLCGELRKVYGLSSFAKIFGFDLKSGEDWTWHDVAVAMARRIEQGPETGDDEHERGL